MDDLDINFDQLIPDEDEQSSIAQPLSKSSFTKDEKYNDELEPWLWNGKPIDEIPNGHKSFVYLFTNRINGRQYIGFKTAVSQSTRTVKGKKKRQTKESDWKTYFSSSQELLHDVAKYGRGNFIREIIALTIDKSVGKYVEAMYQFDRGVLVDKTNRYYNGIINLRLNHRLLGKFDQVEYADIIIGDQLHELIFGSNNQQHQHESE